MPAAAAPSEPAATRTLRKGQAHRIVFANEKGGTGKSTTCRALAKELDAKYIDTGAMYRALTWWCLERGIDRVRRLAARDLRALDKVRVITEDGEINHPFSLGFGA